MENCQVVFLQHNPAHLVCALIDKRLVDNGVEGFLVPPREPALLADAMFQVLSNPQLGKRMGEAGRDKVEGTYDIRSVTKQTLALFGSFWELSESC